MIMAMTIEFGEIEKGEERRGERRGKRKVWKVEFDSASHEGLALERKIGGGGGWGG